MTGGVLSQTLKLQTKNFKILQKQRRSASRECVSSPVPTKRTCTLPTKHTRTNLTTSRRVLLQMLYPPLYMLLLYFIKNASPAEKYYEIDAQPTAFLPTQVLCACAVEGRRADADTHAQSAHTRANTQTHTPSRMFRPAQTHMPTYARAHARTQTADGYVRGQLPICGAAVLQQNAALFLL